METLRAIVTRRRTEKFKPKPDSISEDMRTDLLRSAMSAPSEGRKKPWHFVVIEDDKRLRDLIDLLRQPDSLNEAAMSVVVCADGVLQEHMGHWAIDCAAATENLILAAHGKGLGSTWTRIFPSKSRMKHVAGFLGVPDHVTPFSAVFLGPPAKPLGKRATSFQEEHVHSDVW